MQKFVIFLFTGVFSFQVMVGEAADFHDARVQLVKILTKNILPFWYPQVIDSDHGGYRLNHDRDGTWRGAADKHLVTQARTVWFFSRLCRTPYRSAEFRSAAECGFQFLRTCMWDQKSGGFFWSVSNDGKTVKQAEKHLYGQAFGLYALSEYAKVFEDETARALADRLFSLLQQHAHDAENGGYREAFQRDWTALPAGTVTRLGVPPDVKLMNTHLHLMEALTTYYRLSKTSLARQRLYELVMIQAGAVVRKKLCACTDQHAEDWTPLHGPSQDRVSYGHDTENVWLLQEACDALDLSNGPLLDLYHGLFDYSLTYGFDAKQGGLYYYGPFEKPAENKSKDWWVQAECLVSALKMYRLSSKDRYRDCFFKTLKWIVTHQVDWKNGDWHARIAPDGTQSGGKAGAWKSPYHNGRAVLRCLELLPGS